MQIQTRCYQDIVPDNLSETVQQIQLGALHTINYHRPMKHDTHRIKTIRIRYAL
jgi:hypothetical protein